MSPAESLATSEASWVYASTMPRRVIVSTIVSRSSDEANAARASLPPMDNTAKASVSSRAASSWSRWSCQTDPSGSDGYGSRPTRRRLTTYWLRGRLRRTSLAFASGASQSLADEERYGKPFFFVMHPPDLGLVNGEVQHAVGRAEQPLELRPDVQRLVLQPEEVVQHAVAHQTNAPAPPRRSRGGRLPGRRGRPRGRPRAAGAPGRHSRADTRRERGALSGGGKA